MKKLIHATNRIRSSAVGKYIPSWQFIKYALVGATGATLDFTIFFILTHPFHINYLIANLISVIAGITNNFIWNSVFTFKKRDNFFKRYIKFFSVGSGGVMISSVMLYVLVDIAHTHPLIAKLIALVIITFIQYNLNKRFTFAEAAVPDEQT